MIPSFSDVMALRPVDGRPGSFAANLNEHWTIGPKVHGGVMVALCAKAAREAYRQEGGAEPPGVRAVAVSVSFLSAPDPGAVRLDTIVRKRGRRIGLVDVELWAASRVCVHAVVTLGVPEDVQDEPLLSVNPVAALMAPEPPPDVPAIAPGHPAGEINNLARGCHIHPLVPDPPPAGEAPLFQTWARPKDGPVDDLFALMCGDISLPAPYALGRRGWAPTVQLTAYLRAVPADGWLRVLATAALVGEQWFDEDHTVVDSAGRIVVQTRQLALVASR